MESKSVMSKNEALVAAVEAIEAMSFEEFEKLMDSVSKCKSCGRLIEEHTDDCGRWEPCIEQVIDTIFVSEAIINITQKTRLDQPGLSISSFGVGS